MSAVKSAVSVPREIFDQVEEAARELKVPRSQIFVMALTDWLRQRAKQRLTDEINAAYADPMDPEEMEFLRLANARMEERLRREEEGAGVEPWK